METISIQEKKKALRKEIKSRKANYSKEELKAISKPIIDKLLEDELIKNAHLIMAYFSMPDEVYTHTLLDRLLLLGKEVLLPVVISKTDMEIRYYKGKANMQIGAYGVLEPMGEAFTNFKKIDTIIVPGVAFDHSGNRMGHGCGYYDRFLPKATHAKLLGICFPFQVVDEIPTEDTDQTIDKLVF